MAKPMLGSPSRQATASVFAACLAVLGTGAVVQSSEQPDTPLTAPGALATALEPGEDLPGGAATSRGSFGTTDAFSNASGNIGFERELDFKIGNALFRKLWVSSPASTKSSDGLGPLFNARACQSCHLKDGRGQPPSGNSRAEQSASMFLRLSIPPGTAAQQQALASGQLAVIPEPTYGTQLQEFGIQGHPGEARMQISYAERQVTLADGEIVSLRVPTYSITDPAYGPLHPQTLLSPRLTPQMIGLGLLEAVPEADIVALADPDDHDSDGISGRPNRLRADTPIGRFGWKAGQPSIHAQSGDAFAGDIGVSNVVVPRVSGDCTPAQTACQAAPHGAPARTPNLEIAGDMLDLVAFYARNLAVPARRNPAAADVLAGKALFRAIGCVACHTPRHRTGQDSSDAHLRAQSIWPYTDLLLHDMGPQLADGRPEGAATGTEWRTPPLWGIGLTGVVNGNTFYLHDGRARTLTEAILWHGGEGQSARDGFAGLTAGDRQNLLKFIESL